MIEYRFLRCNYDALTSQENMALDVSRIILQPTFELTTTDIASHALTALEQNFVRFLILLIKINCKNILANYQIFMFN